MGSLFMFPVFKKSFNFIRLQPMLVNYLENTSLCKLSYQVLSILVLSGVQFFSSDCSQPLIADCFVLRLQRY